MTGTAVVAQTVVTEWTWNLFLLGIGFALYAALVATGTAFVYRWYTTRPIHTGVAVLVAVSLVSVAVAIEGFATGTFVTDTPVQHHLTGLYILGVVSGSAIAGVAGQRFGDHTACGVFDIEPLDATGEVASLVRSAGVSVRVTLPETVETVDGYEAPPDATRRALVGRTFRFPRRLDHEELRDRLTARIERDFDVDHVELEVDERGAVQFLALGVRPTGIGPTLSPGTVAVAVRGDPSPDATSGDPVELWSDGPTGGQLVATGSFRASAGDVTTVVIDEDDATALSDEDQYRLVTRPGRPDDSDELVSVIRVAPETVTTVQVRSGGPMEGEFVGWLPADVLVIERDGDPLALPEERETLRAGDTVYVLGEPAAIHTLAEYERERTDEAAAGAPGAAVERETGATRQAGAEGQAEAADAEAADPDTDSAPPSQGD